MKTAKIALQKSEPQNNMNDECQLWWFKKYIEYLLTLQFFTCKILYNHSLYLPKYILFHLLKFFPQNCMIDPIYLVHLS